MFAVQMVRIVKRLMSHHQDGPDVEAGLGIDDDLLRRRHAVDQRASLRGRCCA